MYRSHLFILFFQFSRLVEIVNEDRNFVHCTEELLPQFNTFHHGEGAGLRVDAWYGPIDNIAILIEDPQTETPLITPAPSSPHPQCPNPHLAPYVAYALAIPHPHLLPAIPNSPSHSHSSALAPRA